jgi:hypothetical protein
MMTQKPFDLIVVDGEQLAREVAYGEGHNCLDFQTGGIVPAMGCAQTDIGEGRAALHNGKRFIRIPPCDEISKELKARYDDAEWGDYQNSDDLLPNNSEAEEVREIIKPIIKAARQDPGYRDYCDHLHEDLAAEETALRWIASLRPTVMVGLMEEGLGMTLVYDPADEQWNDAM